MDNRRIAIIVLLDLLAAFDTVNTNTLMNILRTRFDIDNTPYNWSLPYLSDRSQRIKTNGTLYKSCTLVMCHKVVL